MIRLSALQGDCDPSFAYVRPSPTQYIVSQFLDPMVDAMSPHQHQHASGPGPGFSPRHAHPNPSTYPLNYYAAAITVCQVSLHTYLLVTILAINLILLWRMFSGGVKTWYHAKIYSSDKSSAFYAVQSPSWAPKVRLAWKGSGQAVRDDGIQGQGQVPGQGGRLRLELDFVNQYTPTRTRKETGPLPGPVPEPPSARAPEDVNQNLKADVKSLRFGVDERLAPVQELDGDAVLMPRSKDISERSTRLRGGVGPQTTRDPEANTDADAGIDVHMESETSHTIPDSAPNANIHDEYHRIQHMRSFLQLEDHIEGVLQEFDELEMHRTGSLLREALTRNERRRLIALYHRLERRLEEHMRALGVDVDDSEMNLDDDDEHDEVFRSAGRSAREA